MNRSELDSDVLLSMLKVLSDETRLFIMKLLQSKEYCVCELVEMFDMSQPAISQHLRKLKQNRLVIEARRGQWRYYSLNESHPGYDFVLSILNQITDSDKLLQGILAREAEVSCK